MVPNSCLCWGEGWGGGGGTKLWNDTGQKRQASTQSGDGTIHVCQGTGKGPQQGAGIGTNWKSYY